MSLTLQISNMQNDYKITNVPETATVKDIIMASIRRMSLPVKDSDGIPINYRAHLEREGRHLNDSELAGAALKDEDLLTFEPNIEAGNAITKRNA